MNKRIRVADIYRTLGLLNKYKIKYHGNILVGFDNESYADIAKEISILPRGYNIFPVLVQPFIGTKDGQTRLLTDEQANYLDAAFTENVINQGMYKYPSLEKAMGN